MRTSFRNLCIAITALSAASVPAQEGADKTQDREEETAPLAVLLTETTREGELRVSPTAGVSGEYGTWTVTYTVGQRGIRRRGGVRVQLPDSWHSGPRNSANRLQATDPRDEHFVAARSNRPGVVLRTIVEAETARRLVKHAKPSLDGRRERYVFVVRVLVSEGDLHAGDEISVVYGERSGGSPGYRAAAISTSPEPILVAVDRDGTSRFRLHSDQSAVLTSRPGPAVEMLLFLPSGGVVGQPLSGTVALVDKEYNPATPGGLRIRLQAVTGDVSVPEFVTVPPERSSSEFRMIPESAGIVRLRATAVAPDLVAVSNPLEVRSEAPRWKLYWGDLHSHTRYSWDGVGDQAFEYARSISALDFYAMTDHSVQPHADGSTRGLSAATWEEYCRLSDAHYEPGRFVTLHAYECSMGRPWGHHNVYFRGRPGPLLYPSEHTLPDLWAALRGGEALTIPHHTGKFPAGIVFAPQNPLFRRNFEIYSGHGLSEAYDPGHPLAFEKSLFTADSKSLEHPSFAQDAWRAGLKLSTIASTDDHRSHPGMPHYGLVAVRARELTREAIFDALFERRTYATTGARILLDFRLSGASMGQLVAVSSAPKMLVRAVGTGLIARVELLRFRPGDGGFAVVESWAPQAMEFRAEVIDRDWRAGAVYYVRLEEANLVRGLAVMAWSSPIWTIGTDG